MTDDHTLVVIRRAVEAASPGFSGDDDVPLIAGRVLDSLSLLTVVSALEKELGVTIGDREVLPRNFASINAIRAFLAEAKGC